MALRDVKPPSRKRLMPLIEARLNDQRIPELVWIDKEKKIFRMPWRHHKAAKWGDPDAFMLRELAKVMYNYSGPDIPSKKDLSGWKGLLRNNLKTLCDFEELRHMHVLEGDNPYKVYRFVSNGTKHNKGDRRMAVQKCQRQGNHCRRNDVHVATERSSENMVHVNNGPDFLDDSVYHGCFLMTHAGNRPCGSATCDNVNVSSSHGSAYQEDIPSVVSSYTNDSNSHFTTLSNQDNEQGIFDQLFTNTDLDLQQTNQFEIDDLVDAHDLGSNESSAHGNSSSENMPYVNDGLYFLEESLSQAFPSRSDLGDDSCDNATNENVNVSSSQGSVCQQRSPYGTNSRSSVIDGSVNNLLQPVDEDDISIERFLIVSSSLGSVSQQRNPNLASSRSSGKDGSINSLLSDQDDISREPFRNLSQYVYQNTSQFDVNARQWEGFDIDFNESEVQSNIFRSRSPLTTGRASSTSQTSSSYDTTLRDSSQRVSPNGLSRHHALATPEMVYNNIPYVVTSLSLGRNYSTCASNTEASPDTGMASDLAETLVDSDLLTGEGTSADMANNVALSGFSRRTFLSLNRMLSVKSELPLGIEVSYYNCPSIQPRMMPGEFRICFVADSDERDSIASFRNDKLIGPRNVHRLELPPAQNCPRLSNSQITNTNKVLSNLKAGIIVSLNKGHIYATRYCRAGALFSVSGQTNWQKLEHLIQMKIFDYDVYQLPDSLPNQIPNAQPFVRLSFAARDPEKRRTTLVLTVDIWHMEALLLARQAEENSPSLEPDLSLSNDFDRILSIGEMLKKSTPPAV